MEQVKAGAIEYPAFRLHAAAIGQQVVKVESMIGGEVRWHYLSVHEGKAALGPKHRPVVVLRTVQGVPGLRPSYDSSERPYATEMLASTLVVDAQKVQHEWTKVHDGLMIVQADCWIGVYWQSRLIHTTSPHERPYRLSEAALIERLATALGIPVTQATADRLLDDLTVMRLR